MEENNLQQKKRYIKNKNVFVILHECTIVLDETGVPGYVYVNEALPGKFFVRTQEDFNNIFQKL